MLKQTLNFGNPAYLHLENSQLVIRLPDIEKNTGDTKRCQVEKRWQVQAAGNLPAFEEPASVFINPDSVLSTKPGNV